jgi:hypothetical protein
LEGALGSSRAKDGKHGFGRHHQYRSTIFSSRIMILTMRTRLLLFTIMWIGLAVSEYRCIQHEVDFVELMENNNAERWPTSLSVECCRCRC